MQTSLLSQILTRRMLTSLMMGFACGLPLLLTAGVLQAWMREAGIDLSVIGLMALVGVPYTLKFLWAPLFDRYTLPFLGRRRGWMLVTQVSLIGAIIGLGMSNPEKSPWMVAFMALLVTFFSASQDIVVDAYRREDLSDEELGLGSSLYVNGYRVGMLLASGGGLVLADHIPFPQVYYLMAAAMLIGVMTTLFSPEPPVSEEPPHSLQEAVIDPLREYFSRNGAVLILVFILLYKLGDTVAASITTPFYLDVGFTKSEIGAVVKLFGFWATIGGGLLGGIWILRLGIYRALWFFGILQALSTAGFVLLSLVPPHIAWLSAVIGFENLSAGMGTAAYAAFMASLTNKKFTATQYALLTSLMGIPRVLVSAPAGWMAQTLGWTTFFAICTIVAIPGLWMLLKWKDWLFKTDGNS